MNVYVKMGARQRDTDLGSDKERQRRSQALQRHPLLKGCPGIKHCFPPNVFCIYTREKKKKRQTDKWEVVCFSDACKALNAALKATELQSGKYCVVKCYPLLLWSRDCGRGGIRTGLWGWALGV